jgi:hypothetical protein
LGDKYSEKFEKKGETSRNNIEKIEKIEGKISNIFHYSSLIVQAES